MNGIRFYSVIWSIDTKTASIDMTIEAAHSRRYLSDQIRAGAIREGHKSYFKIQEIEAPMIDLSFVIRVFNGKAKKKELDACADQFAYILELLTHCAARVRTLDGEVIER